MFENAHGALCLVLPGHFQRRSKHLELSWKFFKDCIDNGVLKPVPVSADTMIADLGTTARPALVLQIATAAIYFSSLCHLATSAEYADSPQAQALMMSVRFLPLLQVDSLDPQAKLQVRLSFQRYHSLHTE